MKQPSIYHISVTETLCKTVSVYAESEDAALELVRDRYRERDIELFADDLDSTDFDVLDHEDDADPRNADFVAGDAAQETARDLQTALFAMPEEERRKPAKEIPMYARDDAGRLVVLHQPLMF